MTWTELPPYKSKPGTERYKFYFNGVTIPIERHPSGQWRCWIEPLREEIPIILDGVTIQEAQESLRKLLLLHFEALVNMLKDKSCVPTTTYLSGTKAAVITNTSSR